MRKQLDPKIGRNAVPDETQNIIMRDCKSSLEQNDNYQVSGKAVQKVWIFKDHNRIDHISYNKRQGQANHWRQNKARKCKDNALGVWASIFQDICKLFHLVTEFQQDHDFEKLEGV